MDLIFLKSLRPLYCDYISRILCVRRAQQRRPSRPPFMYFYSRPYARGNPAAMTVSASVLNFYSRPYARGDLRRAVLRTLPLLISTRAPTRGATCRYRACAVTTMYFYSRPYERGDRRGFGYDARTGSFLLAPLREGRPQPSILDVARGVFLLAPLREGRQQFFTKPQVDLYDKFLKIHIFQINTFCILQHSFENFKDYFVGSARTSRKNVYGKGWR